MTGIGLLKESILPGDYREGATPVPIPNTEVKPLNADGTALGWESRSSPGFLIFPLLGLAPSSTASTMPSPMALPASSPETSTRAKALPSLRPSPVLTQPIRHPRKETILILVIDGAQLSRFDVFDQLHTVAQDDFNSRTLVSIILSGLSGASARLFPCPVGAPRPTEPRRATSPRPSASPSPCPAARRSAVSSCSRSPLFLCAVPFSSPCARWIIGNGRAAAGEARARS